jgi:fatty acid desaturase
MRKQSQSAGAPPRYEIPTLVVALLIFGGLVGLTLSFHMLPRWLVAVLGTLLLTWYGSLQHETIHGHPTPWRRINSLLGALPLTLWIPYALYRESHLRHHRHEGRYLTDVNRDPESFYWLGSASASQSQLTRAIIAFNCTLVGRLLVGPALIVCRFWGHEISKLRRGVGRRRALWGRHMLGLILIFGWLVWICHISVMFYVACLVYPSISLGLLRSFAEHRADSDVRRRTRAVEAGQFWSLIFLNNNLHIAHHAHPLLPWYQLPHAWSAMRAAVSQAGLVMTGGYLEVAKRYFLRSAMSAECTDPGSTDPTITAGASAWPRLSA